MVQGQRDIKIDWRPFSLAVKNNKLSKKKFKRADKDSWSPGPHRVLRVMMAAQKHKAKLIDLYTSFGIEHHLAGNDFDDEMILRVLKQHKLPSSLLLAADSQSYDKELKDSIKLATDVAGDDIGTPTIIFNYDKAKKSGFFGPILQTLPTVEEALKLWDSLSVLATNAEFYELKRSRPTDQPDVFSTSHC